MLSVNREVVGSRPVIWAKLRNFEKVCKRLFLEEKKYFMCKINHVKRELGVANAGLFEGQM